METGQTIAGKYRLKRLLGTGGMASVWSATNVFTERDFAVKFMLPQVARTPEAAHRFLIEAKVSGRIDHPNIIEVIDVGQGDDGSLFLVMELLNGAALDVAARRQNPPMSVYEFIGYMREVALALAAAHRSGVIHRDLKPTNIFLHKDRDGRLVPKILDFGVSKILEEEQNAALTIAGTVLGSPHYMSPEQAIGATDIDGRTDIFAFGGILFEALTGRRAYDAPNFNALIVTIATTEPESIDSAAPHLPDALRALVRDCMVKDRDGRPASFDPIIERLTAMMPELEHSGLQLPIPRSAESMVSSGRSPQPTSGSPQPTSGKHAATLAGLQNARTFMRGWHPRAFAFACGLVVLLAIGVGLAATLVRRASSAGKTSPASVSALSEPAAEQASPASPAPSSSADDVPVISVDSLPVAARPARRARLSITASPGWCSISVDGIARGVTPVTASDLSAGVHRVECIPPIGKPQSATLSMTEGSSARHSFTLEE
jgi:serine/threonine-protein kinase